MSATIEDGDTSGTPDLRRPGGGRQNGESPAVIGVADAEAAAGGRGIEISVAAFAWVALTAVFLALRIAPVFRASVSGAELIHLSGAWQARIGSPDDRFVPTLFQALAAGLLHFSSSEAPARLLAFIALASTPVALYLLRPRLGEAGALLALGILAFDAPAINLGVSASAMGFDIPLTLWLLVAMVRFQERAPVAVLVVAGFLVATAGPLPLPLLSAWATVGLARGRRPSNNLLIFGGGGLAVGVLAASLRFGLGADGLRVPPFDLFAASFDELWSTATAGEVMALYSAPLFAAGITVAAVQAVQAYRGRPAGELNTLLLIWTAFSGAWFLAAASTNSAISVSAVTMPLALLLGPALAAGVTAMWRADWQYARFLLPVSGFTLLLMIAVLLDWARADQAGDGRQQLLVAVLALGSIVAAGIVAYDRRSAPALIAGALVLALIPTVPGALRIAASAGDEPLLSPMSPRQARELRDLALQRIGEKGGSIVVHPAYRDAATWPFRDSGNIVVASRVPPEAAVVLWPPSEAPPEGFTGLDGKWALSREVLPPEQSFLPYLRWLTDRNVLAITPGAVAVYLRAKD
ncbi:MAG: hypothetical protein HYX53_06675 [Chloroflexi bacterium]|nr:hypothetical protein [Chloroflexota bacterium]